MIRSCHSEIGDRKSVEVKRLRKILCVDDSQYVHRWEGPLLERYRSSGTQIVHAYDGLEAFRKLVDHPDVDLILLDLEMPVMTGLAFLENRRRSPFAHVPVIVISNDTDRPHIREHVVSLGALGMIAKPFGPDELQELIEKEFGPQNGER